MEKTFEMFVHEDKRDPKGIDLMDRLERCSTFHLRHVQFYSGFKLLNTKVGHQQWGEILRYYIANITLLHFISIHHKIDIKNQCVF